MSKTISVDDVYNYWVNNNVFNKSIEQNSDKPTFSFYDGPPFATGLPHYGHILAGLIKDSILRFQHNQGLNVPRNAGWDCHGLPIEYEIEKKLGIKTTDEILKFGIGNYNEECRNIVMKYSGEWESIMGQLGRWIDFKNDYKTMTPDFMNSVWWVFKQLYDKGRVYEGLRIMPYSTTCGTSLSNFETQQNYQEVKDDSLFIMLSLVNKFKDYDTSIMIWTTTPWTLPANYALCVNSTIEYSLVNYKSKYLILATSLIEKVFKELPVSICVKFMGLELIGLEYIPAFTYNTEINKYKIIADNYVTDSDGTGIVHIAPAYGEDDYRVSLLNELITKESKLFQPLNTNGFVTNDIPELQGMFYKNYKDKTLQDLNTKVVIMLKEKGFYFNKRQIIHNYPFCWRSDTPLIYRSVSSWFIKVEDIRDRMVNLNTKINWIPPTIGANRFSKWLENARDWGISRSRFWGTPIPIWKSEDGDIICIGSSYELEELANLPVGSIKDLHRHFVDNIVITKNGKTYKRILDVFDCWLESGSMPYASINKIGIVELLRNSNNGIEYDNNKNPYIKTKDNKIHNILPADFIAEGLDQTRGWFYTLLVLSTSLFDNIPFKNVIVNGLVLAEDGKKMSKRLQNYPDPMEIVKEYGSDCLRLYLLSSSAVKAESLKFSKAGVHQMMKEIIIPFKNTIVFFKEYYNLYIKQYNTSPIINFDNYILINPLNIWILSEYSKIRLQYYQYMKEYDLKPAINLLFKLVQILNNGYIKLGRMQLKGKEDKLWEESLSTLCYVIKYFINDFKSVIPFFCEQQYLELVYLFDKKELDIFWNNDSIHLNNTINENTYITIPKESQQLADDFDIVYNIICTVHQLRSSHNISLKKPLKNISIVIDDKFETIYSNKYRNYLSYIYEECNIMDINIIGYNDLTVVKTIKPNKALLFKKYSKSISNVFIKLESLNSNELEKVIDTCYENFELDSSLFNITYDITFKNNSLDNHEYIFKDFMFGSNKITIVADKYYDQEVDKLYYYRIIATKIQQSRKLAGLHPWDKINTYYSGISKYNLEEELAKKYIKNIIQVDFNKYNNEKIFFEKEFEDIDVKLYLELN